MSAETESIIRARSTEEVPSPETKPSVFESFNSYVKKACVVRVEEATQRPGSIEALLDLECASAILVHAGREDSYVSDVSLAVAEVRRFEKEKRRSIFLVLSVVDIGDYTSEGFVSLCKLVYTSGIDAILVRGALKLDPFRFIRDKALGLRGRRVKILLDDVSQISEVVGAVDGVVIGSHVDSASQLGTELLSQHKMVWVRDSLQTDSVKADAVIFIRDKISQTTPPTTVPSSPVSSVSGLLIPSRRPRSFLFRELIKNISQSIRVIIALSDDGMSAWEMSIESRLHKTRIPLILGLSASESTCRFMGCLYGVIPLQTQSFISINTVVQNALCYAKDHCLVEQGDEVLLVTQPPPVTASTNESCFEGVVQRRIVM